MLSVLSGLCILVVFIAWVRPRTFEVLIDKGTGWPSLGKQSQFTALVMSTWMGAWLTVEGELKEWFFGLYMAIWAGAAASSLWLQIKGGTSTSTSTETTKTTETVTVPKPKDAP